MILEALQTAWNNAVCQIRRTLTEFQPLVVQTQPQQQLQDNSAGAAAAIVVNSMSQFVDMLAPAKDLQDQREINEYS